MSAPGLLGAALRWSYVGELALRLLTAASLLIVAHFLTPLDLGVVSAITLVVTLAQVLWDAGLGRSLVQTTQDTAAAADVVFWTSMGLAVLLYAAACAAAPAIALYFGDERIAPALRVQALQMPLAALSTVHQALFQKALNFKPLSQVRLWSAFVPAVVAIPLAAILRSYWALVAGALAGALLQAGSLWWRHPWRPRLRYDRAVARRLLGFGGWVTAEALLGWAFLWLDAIILGAALGAATLGLFRTGNQVGAMLLGLCLGPALPVLFSFFAQAQADPGRIARQLQTVIKIIGAVSLPLGVWLLFAGDSIEALLLGPAWAGFGLVCGWLGLMHGLTWLVGANGEVYRAIGRPELGVLIMASALVLYVPCLLLASRHGLEAFVFTRVALGITAVVWHLAVAARCLAVPAGRVLAQLRWIGLATALLLAIEWLVADALDGAGHGLQLAATTAALLVYVAALWPERAFFGNVMQTVRSA